MTSNAIVLVRDGRLIGMGPGQTSRVDAARGAVAKARAYAGDRPRSAGAACASDAFYPFPDAVEVCLAAGRDRVRPARRLGPRRRGRRRWSTRPAATMLMTGHPPLPPLMAGSVGHAPGRPDRPWHVPMTGRDPAEAHRASTPLELLFDLCFVVAVAQAAPARSTTTSPTGTSATAS